MIIDVLKPIAEKHQSGNRLLMLTLLKEALQDYILHCVYSNVIYNKLIFTGGTALRKLHGLPRHSEDLDFDFESNFSIETCTQEITRYFEKQLFYPAIFSKIAKNRRTFFIKFPHLLKEIGVSSSTGMPTTLFVRCDFSEAKKGDFETVVTPVTTATFSFFTRSYDLSTLFANKINAFLERNFFKGNTQSIPFKGRDVFDLVWLFQESTRRHYTLQPRWSRIQTQLGYTKQQALEKIREKVLRIDPIDVKTDLLSFIDDQQTIDTFAEHFQEILKRQLEDMNRYEAG